MAKIDAYEFKRQLEACNIIDPRPYITWSGAFREVMAAKGLCIDEIIPYDDPLVLVTLIRHNYATEHYEKWKTHKDKRVRQELARRGFWPEVFIKDENNDVRAMTVAVHPELIMRVRNSGVEWANVKYIVENDPNVTVEALDFFLSLPHHGGQQWKINKAFTNEVYDLKRAAMQTQASALEATMKVSDLYKVGNPLWARGLTIEQIRNLLSARNKAQIAQKEREFVNDFDKFLELSDNKWETEYAIERLIGIRV